MAWAPDTHKIYRALASLELLVAVDYWITPTAALADYVMPAADWMERPTCTTCEDAADYMLLGDRAVVPEGERHVDYDFFRGLGIRLGQEEYWPWPTYEDSIEYRVARCGYTYERAVDEGALFSEMRFDKHLEIREDGNYRGFATTSGRVEVYSSIIQDLGYDPVPEYRELPESPVSNPALAEKYPLILTTGGRFTPMFHSEFRQLGLGTRERWPWPYFTINRTTAQDLDIRDGDWCWIENQRGRIRQKAKLTTSINPGVVTVQASWWYPEMPMTAPNPGGCFESNANVLTSGESDVIDPACGCWLNRGLLCRVYRCDEPFPSELLVPQSPDFEDGIPPIVPEGLRKPTPLGPVREDNYGPYGVEWGTCPAPDRQ
jgi:anaerobic selenocysteine-containing dehydrogenase